MNKVVHQIVSEYMNVTYVRTSKGTAEVGGYTTHPLSKDEANSVLASLMVEFPFHKTCIAVDNQTIKIDIIAI